MHSSNKNRQSNLRSSFSKKNNYSSRCSNLFKTSHHKNQKRKQSTMSNIPAHHPTKRLKNPLLFQTKNFVNGEFVPALNGNTEPVCYL